ncbi:hypothetical protein Skr01_58390 [Sphaerisporangium krabiense]|uniref:Uncharacterized protein n=1 Tax=Sphaerisporangium krabiense TaxID=763782 RepID=A0A7W9DTH2_9ACTN|nr:hypothetical protein [Sphaerisporangium krabiense]GII65754.1 hypothetical protein Skr01_58390 [Sphaerisporangium krabiense]
MPSVAAISDRIVAKLVPSVAAGASSCFTQSCGCQANRYSYRECCWIDQPGGPYTCLICYRSNIPC